MYFRTFLLRGGWTLATLAALMMPLPGEAAPPSGGRGGGARPAGGGGRPSGGMSRPSGGGGGARPGGGSSRPSLGSAGGGSSSRPAAPSRGMGGGRPSLGGAGSSRPSGNRPGQGGTFSSGNAGQGARPNPNPATRPNNPGGATTGNRRPGPPPGTGGNGNPNVGGNENRPRPGGSSSNRPGTRPGTDRPSLGGANRPGNLPGLGGNRPEGNRPGPGDRGGRPGDFRPGDFGSRPGAGRPGLGDNGSRPGQGNVNRPGDRDNRPGDSRPGSHGNRPVIGGHRPGGGNIHIGNRPNFNQNVHIGNNNWNNNRWHNNNWNNNNWNHRGWGWNGGGWNNRNWHHHYVNPHYNWYHGSWGGYGNNNWYRPFFWGTMTGWGLSSLAGGWGYGYGYGNYYNPYYGGLGGTYASAYNYSQPVVVYNYITPDDGGSQLANATAPPAATDPGIQEFDQGLAAFKAGDYQQSLTFFDAAIRQQPKDPVIHEVRALALFAVGAYSPAAAALNSLLSTAPGMDWTTLSSLYGNVEDYTTQLRQLESYCGANPTDAAAYFVLAYHYLVTGARNEAIGALKVVVQNQPKDVVAQQLLETLVPPEPAQANVSPPTTPGNGTATAENSTADNNPENAPETDLVGSWQAVAGETTIRLTITPESNFTWKVTQQGQPDITVNGQISTNDDEIVMSSKEQGDMGGNVTSLGPDQWQFHLSGAPANDPGLKFARVSP